MEFIDKKINEALEEELMAEESDRVEDFKRKSTKRFFATISACLSKEQFGRLDSSVGGKDPDKFWRDYNKKSSDRLLSDLKRLGLEYQKVTGAWENTYEKSFLVWNTAYTFEQFEALLLKLGKNYLQEAVCIGKWENDKYKINLWVTPDQFDKSEPYTVDYTFTDVSVVEAVKKVGTILTRRIYLADSKKDGSQKKQGKILDESKLRGVMFESLVENHCTAANESMGGFYHRHKLLIEYLGKYIGDYPKNQ